MKQPITRNHGKIVLIGQPLTAPIAHSPAAPDAPNVLLSSWIVASLLSGLVAVSGLIVLVGWLVVRPASRDVIVSNPHTELCLPIARERLSPMPRVVDADFPQDSNMPIDTDEPPLVRLPEVATPSVKAPVEGSDSRLQTPIKWAVDSSSASQARTRFDNSNLIAPIEIARIDSGKITYNVRRLQFAGAAPDSLKLAVTPFVYDDMATLLRGMGDGYRFAQVSNNDLLSFAALTNYDVLFLTCADMLAQDFQAALPLRRFVEAGGTLYASDLRGDLLLAAFPEFRARVPIFPGVPQRVDANVVDKGLQTYLGRKTIALNFDAPEWRPAAFDPAKVTVCLKGAYRNNLGQTWTVPLMVKFRVKKGTVIFTSFHNSTNDSEMVRKALEYLVFSSLSARSEARVRELTQRSGFAAQEIRPFLLSANRATEATHEHQGGGLQIALGFEHVGAKLKLTLRSPSGQTIEHEDQGLYLVELPDAEKGVWRYTITPVELPHASFLIVVAVGTLKS